MKSILDPCSGSRMFYFNKADPRVLFGDIRNETHTLCDGRTLNIRPDQVMDFRALPFADDSFQVVIFDPPHLRKAGETSWLRKKYGILSNNWEEDLQQGFTECFRVLAKGGDTGFQMEQNSDQSVQNSKPHPTQTTDRTSIGQTLGHPLDFIFKGLTL